MANADRSASSSVERLCGQPRFLPYDDDRGRANDTSDAPCLIHCGFLVDRGGPPRPCSVGASDRGDDGGHVLVACGIPELGHRRQIFVDQAFQDRSALDPLRTPEGNAVGFAAPLLAVLAGTLVTASWTRSDVSPL
jgi:hypothetical protein